MPDPYDPYDLGEYLDVLDTPPRPRGRPVRRTAGRPRFSRIHVPATEFYARSWRSLVSSGWVRALSPLQLRVYLGLVASADPVSRVVIQSAEELAALLREPSAEHVREARTALIRLALAVPELSAGCQRLRLVDLPPVPGLLLGARRRRTKPAATIADPPAEAVAEMEGQLSRFPDSRTP